MTAYPQLRPEERREILCVLNKAARAVFPGLLAPLEGVIQAVDDGFTHFLRQHIFQANRQTQETAKQLDEQVRPTLERVSRIDRACFRSLWQRMIQSRVESRLCADALLDLARAFSGIGGKPPAQYAEVAVFKNVWKWPCPLPPGEVYAVKRMLELAEASGALDGDDILSWALRVGDFDRVQRLLAAGQQQQEPGECLRRRIDRFTRLFGHLEGLLLYLNDHLVDYLNALEGLEQAHHEKCHQRTPVLWDAGGLVPPLTDLENISSWVVQNGGDNKWYDETSCLGKLDRAKRMMGRFPSVESYLGYEASYDGPYGALKTLLPATFYVDSCVFRSVVEQVRRWLCYRICHSYRGLERQSGYDPDEVAEYRLFCDVVTAWHELRDRKECLLARCQELSGTEPYQSWNRIAATRDTPREAFWLLPLWLLELRALRLYGRKSSQWAEANRLAAARLGLLACRVNLPDFWNGEPGTILLVLEALRQLAVARSETQGRGGAWDQEMLRCARQILVRMEMIDDARVRRTLAGFVHPVLTALAAWCTATGEDRLEGLCLFEMARSRWLLDHLTLGSRTLLIQPNDTETVRGIKDRLFELLNPMVAADVLSVWREVPDELLREIEQHNADLARLAAVTWLHPDGIRRHVPPEPVVLAYNLEHDPADPPRIHLARPGDPWSQELPGPDARLWRFLLHNGRCHAHICTSDAETLSEKVNVLGRINDRCLNLLDGQPTYKWGQKDIQAYRVQLTKLAQHLLHPWEAGGLLPEKEFPLLIVPCGNLFELPWAALPLHRGGHLIDVAVAGIMPGLGFALWSAERPLPAAGALRVEVFLQAAPQPPTGLQLPGDFLHWLCEQRLQIREKNEATPQRVREGFGDCDALIFLCHGDAGEVPFLQLAPDNQQGRLTVHHLEQMPPADRIKVVLLGACWTGLGVQHAAEDVGGLASVLLLKGVRAVLAGTGWVPVGLIECLTKALLASLPDALTSADLAREARKALQALKDDLSQEATRQGRSQSHPVRWASVAFHGIPWVPPR